MTWAEKDRDSQEQPDDSPFGDFLKLEGTLGMVQRLHLGSCKSISTKREISESDREEG